MTLRSLPIFRFFQYLNSCCLFARLSTSFVLISTITVAIPRMWCRRRWLCQNQFYRGRSRLHSRASWQRTMQQHPLYLRTNQLLLFSCYLVVQRSYLSPLLFSHSETLFSTVWYWHPTHMIGSRRQYRLRLQLLRQVCLRSYTWLPRRLQSSGPRRKQYDHVSRSIRTFAWKVLSSAGACSQGSQGETQYKKGKRFLKHLWWNMQLLLWSLKTHIVIPIVRKLL